MTIGIIIGYLVYALVMGAITAIINSNKGYDGGFAWGFFLGIIGIIVVAVRTDNISHYQYPTPKYMDDEYQKKKTLETGGWVCVKCGRTNASYVGTCGCGNIKPQTQSSSNLSTSASSSPVPTSQPNSVQKPSTEADQVREFKKLMDEGIITPEEFEAKKHRIIYGDNAIVAEEPFIRTTSSPFSDKLFEVLEKCKSAKGIYNYLVKLQWDKFGKYIDKKVLLLLEPIVKDEESTSTNKKNAALTVVDKCLLN